MLPGTGESWCLPTRMLRMLVNQHTMRSVTCAVIRVMIVIRVCYTPITCLQTFFGQINNYRAPGHVCSAHIDTYTYTCVYIYAYAHWIFFLDILRCHQNAIARQAKMILGLFPTFLVSPAFDLRNNHKYTHATMHTYTHTKTNIRTHTIATTHTHIHI